MSSIETYPRSFLSSARNSPLASSLYKAVKQYSTSFLSKPLLLLLEEVRSSVSMSKASVGVDDSFLEAAAPCLGSDFAVVT